MKIGIVIGRIGGPDGVALETLKWVEVLHRLGHTTHILTGEIESPTPCVTLLPPLAFSHPGCIRGQDDAYYVQDVDESELLSRLDREAAGIEAGIRRWIQDEDIDLLLTENSTTLPCHLTMGMALRRVLEGTGIPAISHNHDFHWERGDRYHSRYPGIRQIMDDCFPPSLDNVQHVVINSFCQESLRQRTGIDAVMVPNVMDFGAPFGDVDSYNSSLSADLGLTDADIPLFQVTRIVRRKGIETAIELVRRLDDPRVKLIVTGQPTDDHRQEYYNELVNTATDLIQDGRLHFTGHRFGGARSQNGHRVYSISDAYARALACTYFSRYEGFGNAFVEAVAARRPIFVNNYRPVYWPDIGSKGFQTVQVEDNQLTDQAVADVREVLHDPDRRRAMTEHNFRLGQEHLSYEVLGGILEPLLQD